MKAEDIRQIAVIGAGEMGHGLAELAALHGLEVVLHDIKEEFLERGLERIGWSLQKLADKDRLEEPLETVRDRITTTTDLEEAARGADFVIEAVTEDLDLKKDIFETLDAHAPPEAILASNTSGLSITAMGRATERPGQVVGMHFFNPPVIMELVEVVRGDDTADETIQLTEDLSRRLGKTPIVCQKDVPGFITSRIIFQYMNEGAWIHHEEGVDTETIDAAMKYGIGFPMGPFELADQVGIDLLVTAQEKQDLPVPPPFREMVDAGRRGRKSERGFYDYRGEAKPVIKPEQAGEFDPLRILAPTINEAATLVEMGIAPPEDIDLAMRLGTAFPKGPLAQADEMGLDRVVEVLEASERHDPADILKEMVREGKTGKAAGRGFYEHATGEGSPFKTIRVEVEPDTYRATLILDRPERHNTFTPEMLEEIATALRRLEQDEDVRCLVIRGAGEKAFSAGADVTAFTGMDKAHKAWSASRESHRVYRELASFPKPTVAAIHGYCFGGGLELALACDFRVATTNAKLGLTETSLGLVPGAGGTQRLTQIVGLPKAKEMVFLAQRLGGEEAAAIGLVHRVAPPDGFEEAVGELSQGLAQGPPIALRLAKMLLNRSAQGVGEVGLDLEALAFGLNTSAEDVIEGISAFLSKKQPEFKGE